MAIITRKGFISGRAGNMVYRKQGNVQIVQSAPDKPTQTASTKTSGIDFGVASNSARAIRILFNGATHFADSGMKNRLTQTVLKAMRAGHEGEPGARDLRQADLSLLEGFQFNTNSPLEKVLETQPTVTFEDGGKVLVHIPAATQKELVRLSDAVRFILRFFVAEVDFKNNACEYLGSKDIRVEHRQDHEGSIWEVEKLAERGTIVMVSFSVHYFTTDGINEFGINHNNIELSPAGIIAAKHIGDDGAPADASRFKNPLSYRGNEIMSDFAKKLAKEKTGPDEGLLG